MLRRAREHERSRAEKQPRSQRTKGRFLLVLCSENYSCRSNNTNIQHSLSAFKGGSR